VSWRPRNTALTAAGRTRRYPSAHSRWGFDVRQRLLNTQYGYDPAARSSANGHGQSHGHAATTNRAQAVRGYAADWRPVFADAYRLQSRAWIDALISGTRPALATVEDALTAARVAQALVDSMNSGGATITINHHQPSADESSVGGEHERTLTHV
jgi:myo-inositol 2-dehydrogenase/D-chiro-inositol 1-dehydrogenase